MLEHDPALFSQCQVLGRSPYLSIGRFDKTTIYSIIPRSDKYNYIPKGKAWGMISGPYGVTLSDGFLKLLWPTELIRDEHGIWRDGNGARLEQPKSTLHHFFAELHDFFFRTSRGDFNYRLPTSKLIRLAAGKSTTKIREHPNAFQNAFFGSISLIFTAYAIIKRIDRGHSRARSRSPPRRHSIDGIYTESSIRSRSPSHDRRYIR